MNNFLKQLTVLLHFFPLLYLHVSYAGSYRTNPYNPNTMLFGHELIAVSCADGIKTLVAKKYCHENKKNKSW